MKKVKLPSSAEIPKHAAANNVSPMKTAISVT